MRTILFAGHRLDDVQRAEPRFSPDMETRARAAIRRAVDAITLEYGPVHGMAGAASGGDILFHEVCAELGVPTQVYLPMAQDSFIECSVAPAGSDWVRRFLSLVARVPPVVVPDGSTGSRNGSVEGGRVWERNNECLLHDALGDGAANLTVLVLWDGKPGDGPGGTGHLVTMAKDAGAQITIIDPRRLRGS